MSQGGKKRKLSAQNKDQFYIKDQATKLEVTKAAAENSIDGFWTYWHPDKCQDQIRALNICFEEYVYKTYKTCLLRCSPTNGNPCSTCGSNVIFHRKKKLNFLIGLPHVFFKYTILQENSSALSEQAHSDPWSENNNAVY